MPSSPKLFINKQAYLVSTRTEDGLPFIPTVFVNALIQSCLAKAQTLYPITILAYLFMANHFHLVLVAHNPEDVPKFVGHLKQELSHAVNRLLGRKQKTIWKAEYDSPILLSAARCVAEIAYTLTNPCAASLVDMPEDYIGISSLKSLYLDTPTQLSVPTFRRPHFKKLLNPAFPHFEAKEYHQALLKASTSKATVTINPWEIRNVYPEFNDLSIPEVREKILIQLNAQVLKAREDRIRAGKHIVGVKRLSQLSMLLTYTPKKYSRKSICLGSYRYEVDAFLAFFKSLVAEAKEVYQRWKNNDFTVPYPIGLFPPPAIRKGNLLPTAAFN